MPPGMKGKALNSRSVNDGKVTDHHALIVTENLPGKLETDEQAIYELIAGRMLEAFSGKMRQRRYQCNAGMCRVAFSRSKGL